MVKKWEKYKNSDRVSYSNGVHQISLPDPDIVETENVFIVVYVKQVYTTADKYLKWLFLCGHWDL